MEGQQTLFKSRDKRKKGWFWMDNDYLNGYAKLFGTTGTAIYVSLCRHADNETQKCFPAIKTIAEELNTGESTIKQYIHIFEKYHIISIQREKDLKTKRWLNNVYQLNDKEEWIKPDKPLKIKRKQSQSQPLAMEARAKELQKPEPKNCRSQSQPLAHKETHSKETHNKEDKTGEQVPTPPPNLQNEIIVYFISQVKEEKGFAPEISYKKVGNLLKNLLKRYKPEQLKRLIDYYLASKKCLDLGVDLAICLSGNTINLWLQDEEAE